MKTIHFFRVSNGCFMTVTMSSKRTIIKSFERKSKENELCPDQNKRVFFPNMAWSEIYWSESLKCSCLRNAVVWGSSLMHSPFFVMPQSQCPHRWLETWMNGNPSGSGGGGGDYWIESKGRMFSVSVNFDSRETQTLYCWWCSKGLRLGMEKGQAS